MTEHDRKAYITWRIIAYVALNYLEQCNATDTPLDTREDARVFAQDYPVDYEWLAQHTPLPQVKDEAA